MVMSAGPQESIYSVCYQQSINMSSSSVHRNNPENVVYWLIYKDVYYELELKRRKKKERHRKREGGKVSRVINLLPVVFLKT